MKHVPQVLMVFAVVWDAVKAMELVLEMESVFVTQGTQETSAKTVLMAITEIRAQMEHSHLAQVRENTLFSSLTA